jgi:hypothetical protein
MRLLEVRPRQHKVALHHSPALSTFERMISKLTQICLLLLLFSRHSFLNITNGDAEEFWLTFHFPIGKSSVLENSRVNQPDRFESFKDIGICHLHNTLTTSPSPLTLLVCATLLTIIMFAVWKLTALLGCLVTASNGFSPNAPGFKFHAMIANSRVAPSPTALGLSSWGDADARYEDAFQHNTMRTDLRMFLTQRALQSFIFLSVSCRDPHTVKWLEVRAP